MKFSSKVPLNVSPETGIIEYLSQRFTYHSSEHWDLCVKNGQVFVDGKLADVHDKINAGSEIIYDPGDFEEPPANLDYHIIFEDEWFLGVDKPGNLLVHRAGKSFRNNLIYQIRYVNKPAYPLSHTTHRLDRDTSGVVLIAKSAEAQAAVSEIFLKKMITKQYFAVVYGKPELSQFIIDAPIGKKSESLISYKFQVSSEGKSAQTEIINVESVGNNFSLVTIKPVTGRTHQIRVHLSNIGHPLVGDKLYGMNETEYLAWRNDPQSQLQNMLFYRHALHCGYIEFIHPYTNNICRIEASMPDDMKMLINKLRVQGNG